MVLSPSGAAKSAGSLAGPTSVPLVVSVGLKNTAFRYKTILIVRAILLESVMKNKSIELFLQDLIGIRLNQRRRIFF